MTSIQTISTEYIRYANRTVECVEMIINKRVYHYWIYNYQGNHFRVFDNTKSLNDFLENHQDKSIANFESEKELDNYLLGIEKNN